MLFVAHLVAAAVLLARGLAWLQSTELAAYDRLVVAWAGHGPADRILLVTMTEEDISDHGWPLRDADLAAVLARLTGWGARAIGVDIYRDRPLPPGDGALADLLRQHPEITWIFKLPDEHNQGVPPPSVLAGTGRIALADVVTDAGGVVRRGLIAATDVKSGQTFRTLGAALAEQYTGQTLHTVSNDTIALGTGRIALVDSGAGPYARVDAAGYQTMLDFHGGPDRFPRLSLGALMRDDAAAAMVRGRIVLVGTGALSVKDSFATPFSAHRQDGRPLLGVMLHAYLADQLIRIQAGETASRTVLPRTVDATMIWACAILAAVLGMALPSAGIAFAVTLAGVGVIAGIADAAFGAGLILPVVPAALAWVGAAGSTIWVLHGIGIRDRLRLRRSFEHYLDPRIIKDLVDSDTLPGFGGEYREISVLFTDIAGFTSLAETMPAAQLAGLLHDYFDGVCDAVLGCGGLVSVFLGDGLLALFGAPWPQDDHADRAVAAALRIDAYARRFSAEQRGRGVGFGATRIGVHTGMALVGNIGTRARLSYGAIGDVLNTASRLESLNKRIGTRIAVSGDTARRCTRYDFRCVGEFVLRGRQAALLVVTPLTPAQAADLSGAARYQAAYDAMRGGDPTAREQFAALRRENPDDPCVAFHCERLAAGQSGVRVVMEGT